MLKLRFLASALIFVSLLTSCSSDPYANAGECETPGKSKVVDSKLVVCTGKDSRTKWYSEGKYFEDALLLSKIEYSTFSVGDDFFKKLKEEGLADAFFKIGEKAELSVIDLANYASGDARWDALIEAQAKYEKAKELEDFLFKEELRLLGDRFKGKASISDWAKARDEWIRQRDLVYDLSEERNIKSEVLKATLTSQYKLKDSDEMLILLSRFVNQLS
jgi:hypothetical protein